MLVFVAAVCCLMGGLSVFAAVLGFAAWAMGSGTSMLAVSVGCVSIACVQFGIAVICSELNENRNRINAIIDRLSRPIRKKATKTSE